MDGVELPRRNERVLSFVQWFLIAIIALLIARYSLRVSDSYGKSTNSKYYVDIKFNATTLYAPLYISKDERTITNRPTKYTNRVSSGPSHLHKYTGVILNEPLSIHKKTYIEVIISYKIVTYDATLIFEIGFEEREEIDNVLFLRNTWGTSFVRASICNERQHVCLSAFDGQVTLQTYKISKAIRDKWYDLRLGFSIIPDNDLIKVTYSLDNNKSPTENIYRFINADINDNKWPIFGIYNPHMYEVHMKLNTNKNKWFDSSTIHPMIFISDNELEISNVLTKTTKRKSYNSGQLQKYEGVIANTSFDSSHAELKKWPNKIHFKVKVEYNVTDQILRENFLFELGMSRFKYIDKYWCVGVHRYALTVFGSGCKNFKEICLTASRDGVHTYISTLSSSRIGTNFQGAFEFSVDFAHGSVSISNGSELFVFSDVDLTEPLWPVFAMYKHHVDTLITLNVD